MDQQEKEKLLSEIRKYEGFPDRLLSADFLNFQLLREIAKDVYSGIAEGKLFSDYKELLYEPLQKSPKALLNLSSSLYGYYDEKHIKLRSESKGIKFFPLYLNINSINEALLDYEDIDGNKYNFIIRVEHEPIEDNYWHLEFAVYLKNDKNEEKVFPNTKPGSVPDRISKRILSYLTTTSECLCLQTNRKKYQNILFSDILKKNGITSVSNIV